MNNHSLECVGGLKNQLTKSSRVIPSLAASCSTFRIRFPSMKTVGCSTSESHVICTCWIPIFSTFSPPAAEYDKDGQSTGG